MEFHPIANIFPLMDGEEYEALKTDIENNGLLEPIWAYEDKILDGRNRYRACQDVGVKPQYKKWQGDSPISFVVSLNIRRRHLSSAQRAAAAIKAEELMEELKREAKDRQAVAGSSSAPGRPKEKDVEKIPQVSQGKTRDKAAELFHTNGKYIDTCNILKDNAPDLLDQIAQGTMSIPKAKREYNQRTKQPPKPIAGKYHIWYADPPWRYRDSGVIETGDQIKTTSDNYGRADRHYPQMSIEELCEMGKDIRKSCEKNAVLFLWVTSPLLEESFQVINAWGFKYKSSFVWDKVKHNFGHYNSVRHEFLLICTKGSCTPEVQKLFDSVQSIERTDKHSEKPEEFRVIIDTLYPTGNRIELFARTQADGWEMWGNE